MTHPLPPTPYEGAGLTPEDPPQDDLPQAPGSAVIEEDDGEETS